MSNEQMNLTAPELGSDQENAEEADEILKERLLAKEEKLKNFKPSGNVVIDYNNLMYLIKGDDFLGKEKSLDSETNEVLIDLAKVKKEWLKEVDLSIEKIDPDDELINLIYRDIPLAQAEAVDELLRYYSGLINSEQEIERNKRGE